jgi:hypothetical protein
MSLITDLKLTSIKGELAFAGGHKSQASALDEQYLVVRRNQVTI